MKKLKRTGIRRTPKSKMERILRGEIMNREASEQSSWIRWQFGLGSNFPFLGLGE